MEYALALVIVCALIAWNEISSLKKKNHELENRLNELAKRTGNGALSSDYISDDLKHRLVELKNKGKDVEAVKCLRTETRLDLLTAKQYVDGLE